MRASTNDAIVWWVRHLKVSLNEARSRKECPLQDGNVMESIEIPIRTNIEKDVDNTDTVIQK